MILSYQLIPRLYENKDSIPIYSMKCVKYSAEEAISVLFNASDDCICTEQPTGCRFSATFIVDLSQLAHRDDIRADDLGAWKNCGVRSMYCSVFFNSNGSVCKVKKIGSSKPSVMRHSIYRLKRTYWQHSEDSVFCRHLLELEGTWPLIPNLCVHIVRVKFL